jgi:hypothetical protein
VLAQVLDEGVEEVNANMGTVIPELFRSVLYSLGKENTVVKDAVQVKSNTAGKSSRLVTTVEDAVRTVYEKWVPTAGERACCEPPEVVGLGEAE